MLPPAATYGAAYRPRILCVRLKGPSPVFWASPRKMNIDRHIRNVDEESQKWPFATNRLRVRPLRATGTPQGTLRRFDLKLEFTNAVSCLPMFASSLFLSLFLFAALSALPAWRRPPLHHCFFHASSISTARVVALACSCFALCPVYGASAWRLRASYAVAFATAIWRAFLARRATSFSRVSLRLCLSAPLPL